MTQMLEVTDGEFKITKVNLLKGSSGKGGHIHEQMGEFRVWNENYKQIEMLSKTHTQ